jgi:hypothetical protein
MLVSQALARNNLTNPWLEEHQLDLAQKLACETLIHAMSVTVQAVRESCYI